MMPENALIVKENYDKYLVALTPMYLVALTPIYKVKGYNPDAGNWFWAKYGIYGERLWLRARWAAVSTAT